MKQNKLFYLAFLPLLSLTAHAETFYFHDKCPTVQKCLDFVGNLNGQKYIFPASLATKTIQSTRNLELTKENAELLLTNALYQNGLTRVPIGQSNAFNIIGLMEAPHQAVPVYSGDAEHKPELPKNWDVITLKYKARDSEAAAMIPRLLQDYLPRTGNVLVTAPGYVLITDSAPNVSRLMGVLDAFDQKLSPETKKRLEEHKMKAQNRTN
jgi:hypothetical protein